ncbi:hypothetical protein [Natrarchaeobaculum sulfurireducens]|uniref:Uncharacterized protein n=1 Tax=Natrarchaeobaculum sulfurireducens TaxID=2044521 RepID=A0A346PM86_9EURY|nr:hypothetical protein [Natrarchaeobaculum sulfurireducens]AXR80631.1 hypothetical protein AArcMg_0608 [Natrarchaeobaculum sulfurireducens]
MNAAQTGVVVGGLLLAALLVGVSVVVLKRRGSTPRSELRRACDARLAETHTERRTHLERPPTIRELAVVDRVDDGSVYAPVVRVDLGTADTPGMKLVFEYVASVLEAICPELADEHVERYDLEFTFGPSGLVVSGECRRVSIPASLADRLVENEGFRPFDLRRAVERAEDDPASAARLWVPCSDAR